jgi:PHD/YefM family antitoxin component YafN of YafNO toxin-antitoxin module
MFQTIPKAVGVSRFRASIPLYLKKAQERPLVITARRGTLPFVVLSADAYNKLVEMRENAIDAHELARLVKRDKRMISWR